MHRYDAVNGLLQDDRVTMVLNLTNPRSHYDVSMTCLRAGKHVYSENALAMEMVQAGELIALAESS